jgi:PAS domain-containing protein
MQENYESMYEELLQFLYRTPWGLIQATRSGDIQMLNPVAAKVLMPLAFNGHLDNLFALLRAARPELQTLVAATTERYGVVCEDLPLPGLNPQTPGPAAGSSTVRISIFVQNQDMLMVVLRESQALQLTRTAGQDAELGVLQNLPQLGLLKTRSTTITWSNPAAQRMLGYTGRQLRDVPFADLFNQGVGERVMENCLPTLMAGASYTDRLDLLQKGAANVTLDLTATSTSFEQQEILWTLMATAAG